MKRTLVLAVILAIGLVACGDDDSSTDTDTGNTSDAGATIVIEGFSFGDPITVAVGETVSVQNDDGVAHTWTSAGVFDSGSIGGGESFTFTFDEPGEYSFMCTIHPSMTGSITVTG